MNAFLIFSGPCFWHNASVSFCVVIRQLLYFESKKNSSRNQIREIAFSCIEIRYSLKTIPFTCK
ncbi:hypothetical protein GIB67_004695 [Kingdonia uniflora]|uniref:Uncharacterized protein n=1 Tax=Kingdonia uniflora TaxID=39325 RepID=A0A7J7P500_9MAGN|nr:hypothetical protein GIB67_004695 [Kingdonia uniflora]